MKVITNRDPAFLKAVYPIPEIDLVNSINEINRGEVFIDFKNGYRVWINWVPPIYQGKFKTIRSAIFFVRGTL